MSDVQCCVITYWNSVLICLLVLDSTLLMQVVTGWCDFCRPGRVLIGILVVAGFLLLAILGAFFVIRHRYYFGAGAVN